MKYYCLIACLVFYSCGLIPNKVDILDENKPNIIFIAVDDLRPELGVYGNSVVKSPNIDALARDGILFENAYVQQAACNPSRVSLMTGLRPDYTKVRDLWTFFRDSIPEVLTLPQHFAANGYTTTAIGKVYHNIFPDSLSWTKPKTFLKQFPFDPDAFYVNAENLEIQKRRIQKNLKTPNSKYKKDRFGHYYIKANATEIIDGPDSLYYDGAQNIQAIKQITSLAKESKPFFYALGYYRPHLPFNAPRKYWDLYDKHSISLATNSFIPKNVPSFSVNTLVELRGYEDFSNTPPPAEGSLSEEDARHLKHGYYASVSYIDKLVGDIIAKLKALGIYDNSIIILWGDHGYKLGEHNGWTKFTNYKIDTHAPLIIKSNTSKYNHQKVNQLVEFVDIYPTLCDLANIPRPAHLQGKSQLSIIKDNSLKGKQAVYFQFLKESRWAVPEGNEQMGYSVLTADYHYVYWIDWKTKKYTAQELYILNDDPDENVNVADLSENRELVEHLKSMILNESWKEEI